MTLSELARNASNFLTRDTTRDIVLPTDSAPEWFTDLCRTAHGTMLPDDWRYEFIDDALSAIADECEDMRDVDDSYPYTADRLAWLASNIERPGYCDEAAKEYGVKTGDVLELVTLGMSAEMREVYELVLSALTAQLEAATDAN
jgi:hypothetical protein